MKDRSDDPSHHERTLLPWSYVSLPVYSVLVTIYVANASSLHLQINFMLLLKAYCLTALTYLMDKVLLGNKHILFVPKFTFITIYIITMLTVLKKKSLNYGDAPLIGNQ